MSNKELTLEEIKQVLNDEQAQILEMYLKRYKQKEIMQTLGITRGKIDALVQKYKLSRFRTRNNYSIDESVLQVNNPLIWYFIGWFVSDGNLHKTNSGSEIIQFTLKDEEPLLILKDILKYTGEIKVYNKTVKLQNELGEKVPTKRNYYFLGITNKSLVAFMSHILNVMYAKTFTIEFPSIPNEDCLKMFIRGYWDGDGCFTFNKANSANVAAAHCASILFCNQFKDTLEKYGIDVYILNTTCPEIRINKKEHFTKFVHWLYSIYPDICLSRKKEKAFSLLCK